jgi:hypothetical protein
MRALSAASRFWDRVCELALDPVDRAVSKHPDLAAFVAIAVIAVVFAATYAFPEVGLLVRVSLGTLFAIPTGLSAYALFVAFYESETRLIWPVTTTGLGAVSATVLMVSAMRDAGWSESMPAEAVRLLFLSEPHLLVLYGLALSLAAAAVISTVVAVMGLGDRAYDWYVSADIPEDTA